LTHYIEGEFDGDVLSAWSPDGHRIAFVSDRDGYYAVYIMNSDGSNPIRLTDGRTGNADSPQWSPDGTQIAFTHGAYDGKDYIEDIYLIDVDDALQAAGGSEPINLTDHPADDDSVIWQP
jgi:Tol biopolymer transport system component